MTELIVTLDDSASAALIKRAISLLKGVKQVVTVKKHELTNAQKKQIARIEDLSSLEQNWDGEGALPIDKTVIKNSKDFIKKSNDEILSSWTFFPEVNGTVIFQKNDNSACISIGKNEFSGIVADTIKSHEPYSTKNLISFISHQND